MEVVPDSFHSVLQEEHSEQQQLGMVKKDQNKSPLRFFIFPKMTKAVYKETDRHNVLTDSFHSAVPEGYIKQQ